MHWDCVASRRKRELLNRYTGQICIEGSNPSLCANFRNPNHIGIIESPAASYFSVLLVSRTQSVRLLIAPVIKFADLSSGRA